jgi:DNA-binding winged helix-turn-helix (wHTH) protein/TolB-like protein
MRAGEPDRTAWACGEYTIVPACRQLLRAGKPVDLEAKVFDLIVLLLENRERAVGKQEVVATLWGHRPITDAALSQLLYKARRALDDDGERQAVIRTVYGRGLQWIAPVTVAGTVREPANAGKPLPSPHGAPTPTGPLRLRRKLWFALGALALVGLLSLWIVPRSFAPPAPARLRVALLPVENATGDRSLDWTTRGLSGLVASLLGASRDLDVVDPLEAARAWTYTPSQGRNKAEQMRFATGADVLVEGRLVQLAGKLYQLTLQVDAHDGSAPTILILSGSDPAVLGVNAAARLRRALKLDPPAASPFKSTPEDAYLAETFARGMDLAMHGDWLSAKPYFVVLAKGAPDFLPGRFQLAEAQANTDQSHEADAGYAALLADARRRGEPGMAARVLVAQANQADHRHENTTGLAIAAQAVAAARQANDDELLARALLASANLRARLKQTALALQEYAQARTLVEKGPIHGLEPLLHNTMGYIADAQGDAAAGIAAARAELAADEALGRERSSAIASFNLAYALSNSDHPLEAVPLLARTWNWSSQHHDAALQIVTANLLATELYDMGVYAEIKPVIETATQQAQAQGNVFVQARLLDMRAGGEYFSGDPAKALALCRQASALVDPGQGLEDILQTDVVESFVALAVDPASLAAIERRIETRAARMADPSEIGFNLAVVHTLAAAARDDRKGMHAAFATAARSPGAPRDFVHALALQLALVKNEDAMARSWLVDFDPESADTTSDTLRLYIAWSNRHGDAAGAKRAQVRLDSLRAAALAALAKVPINRL